MGLGRPRYENYLSQLFLMVLTYHGQVKDICIFRVQVNVHEHGCYNVLVLSLWC